MKWAEIAAARQIVQAEQGTIIKDWGGKLPIGLVYPNTYYVGMSSLAVHTLYRLFNAQPDLVCERIFFGERRIARSAPPLSLEGQHPLSDFAALAISLSFELDYLHLTQMLAAAGIAPLATERSAGAPLLLAGGPAVSANPEPLALICDAFLIGEVEDVLPQLLDALRDTSGGTRDEQLDRLATVPGIYVPTLARYEDNVPQHVVHRQWVHDLDSQPTGNAIHTTATEFGDMHLIEIARGCRRACRFCLAGCIYRPVRERSPALLLEQARAARQYRHKVGLVSAAVSDYSRLDELLDGLQALDMRISVSSLRIDPLPERLLRALAASRVRTLTMAPEAGSQRMRTAIRKSVQREDVLNAARRAADYRFPEIKLYFMVGLPGEEEEDVAAIAELLAETSQIFHGRIAASVSAFVPKAHTEFEREAMAPVRTLQERIKALERKLREIGVEMTAESPDWAAVQGVLARGDRRLGAALARTGQTSLAAWRRALHETGLEEDDFLCTRGANDKLPWQFIAVGPYSP